MKSIATTLSVAALSATVLLSTALAHEGGKPDLSKLPPAADKKGLTYEADIKPMFEKSCIKCHSGERPKGKYSMESLEAVIKGGKEGKGIVPGKSAESPVLLFAADAVVEMEMPPIDKREKFPVLTKEQLALVRAWIDQGAK